MLAKLSKLINHCTVDTAIQFPTETAGDSSYIFHVKRNNSKEFACFELRGLTSTQLKLYAMKPVEVGCWWAMTGILSHFQKEKTPRSVWARQINRNVWIFPMEMIDRDTGTMNQDAKVTLCETQLLFHAQYVDYADRNGAHLVLTSWGTVECIRAIRPGQTNIKLYSDTADNYGKRLRSQLLNVKDFVQFLIEQVALQINAMPGPLVSAVVSRDRCLLEVLLDAIQNHGILSCRELQEFVANPVELSECVTVRQAVHQEHIVNASSLWLDLILQFIFQSTSTIRSIHKIAFTGHFADVSSLDFTLIEYYTLFQSVRDKFIVVNSASARLYLRDKLASRVNLFMANSRYFIPSPFQISSCPGASNFGDDYEYLISMNDVDTSSSAYTVS
jgi:hypothetical protein